MSPKEKAYLKDILNTHATWQIKATKLLNALSHWYCLASTLKEKFEPRMLDSFANQKLLEPEHIKALRTKTLKVHLVTVENEDAFTRCLMRVLRAIVRIKDGVERFKAEAGLRMCQRVLMGGDGAGLLSEKGWVGVE